MLIQLNCPCGNNKSYNACCEIVHQDHSKAFTAEELMRARYTAFVIQNIDFIYNTFHPTTRRFQDKGDIEIWAKESRWMQLVIIKSTSNTVEFKAYYLDTETMEVNIHHEKSNFKQLQNVWYYVDGSILS